MADAKLPKPDAKMLNQFLCAEATRLRAADQPPANLEEWEQRRIKLSLAMFAAMGPFPAKPCALEPREVGVLKRDGYRIEKLLLQSRPDVWITASAYVPEGTKGKVPGVLVVHGHWAGARRDPVVQARCLGLVKLGFFVLAVDAFGAGERHPTPRPGTYHGSVMGSALWPVGQSLLGMQVYDNRRAVDYLQSRPEVDGTKLGITGASGGGNQTMYAGALDQRFAAVVPVCSVGNYQAYLKTACCVCEVLPGALRFTEEGDVLGLVAPRALMVISATMDGFQFSVGQANKSLERARLIYKLCGKGAVEHAIFESPHAYNKAMREAMYGWMTRWLKGEGEGKPIPEPEHKIETAEDLSCFPDGKKPAGFLYPTTFALREGEKLLAPHRKAPEHKEGWEAAALLMHRRLRASLGEPAARLSSDAETGPVEETSGVKTIALTLATEPGLALPALVRHKPAGFGKVPAALLLHLGGKTEALKQPLAAALIDAGWTVIAPDLRGTGETQAAGDAIAGAADHNSAEHSVWIGRPLLGQWVADVSCLLAWMERQPGYQVNRLTVIGFGPAGLAALTASAVLGERCAQTVAVDAPTTLLTAEPYPSGTRMGLLAPGLLRAGDVPQLAALSVPRRLLLAGAVDAQNKSLDAKQIDATFAYARDVYKALGAADRVKVVIGAKSAELVSWLTGENK